MDIVREFLCAEISKIRQLLMKMEYLEKLKLIETMAILELKTRFLYVLTKIWYNYDCLVCKYKTQTNEKLC